MKVANLPSIHDKLTIDVNNNKVNVTICIIVDTMFGKGKLYDNKPHLKHNRYICEDDKGNRYQFIIFKDMTVSNVHKIKG